MNEQRHGRPRSPATQLAVFDAVTRLLPVRGFTALSIEGLAAEAGVGKQAIYRRWPSKSAILADWLAQGGFDGFAPAIPRGGHLRHDLITWLDGVAAAHSEARTATILRALAAAAAEDTTVGASLYRALTRHSGPALVERLREAIASGDLPADANADLAAEAILGAILYRLLTAGDAGSSRLDDLVDLASVRALPG